MSILSKFLFILFFIVCVLFGAFSYILHAQIIDLSSLQQEAKGKSSILLDDEGKEWGRFQLDKRKFVALEAMPQYLIQAFLSAEDRHFFHHPGISFRGIIRSILVNMYYGRKVQGASTITQQLVRLLFFDAAKTFRRKIKEQIFSILIERQCSKEQILETYLNNVYFGYGIYGVQAAAQRFWGKNIQDITIDQAALLAAIMRSPQHYCPIHAPVAAKKRRNLILKTMHTLGCINQEECADALEQDVIIQEVEYNCIAPHLKETIRIFLEDLVGKEVLYAGGLTIQTTLHIETQRESQHAFAKQITKLKANLHKDIDGGLISMHPATGEIKALVGGYNYKVSKFNRALQAYRQMGSVFKVFVYAAALEQGASFCDVEIDEPLEIMQHKTSWRPENNTKQYLGPITRACALSFSNNVVTIKTLLRAGVHNVIDLAKRCHIVSYMPPYPSLSLGCVDVTLLETLGAFNVFANNGKYVEPHYIKWVKNNVGDKIYKNSIKKEQVLAPCVAGQVARVLSFAMNRLQKLLGAQWFGSEAIGKTGTTNDSRTCWFCGATPDLTTAMYLGCDNNQSLGAKIYASKTAFPIWFKVQSAIAKNKTSFYYDPRLKEKYINWKTGQESDDYTDPDVVPLLLNLS
ncbi:MAG: hypothetical protein CL947_03095 [Epsilonproteobacteria bacterium]|nr:hypothetical protein [Campylobacterota bacterium]|tara:strand:- start:382 stop:2277 length:1896 start_codon:yes stop_codon:yes gene_type:complete